MDVKRTIIVLLYTRQGAEPSKREVAMRILLIVHTILLAKKDFQLYSVYYTLLLIIEDIELINVRVFQNSRCQA